MCVESYPYSVLRVRLHPCLAAVEETGVRFNRLTFRVRSTIARRAGHSWPLVTKMPRWLIFSGLLLLGLVPTGGAPAPGRGTQRATGLWARKHVRRDGGDPYLHPPPPPVCQLQKEDASRAARNDADVLMRESSTCDAVPIAKLGFLFDSRYVNNRSFSYQVLCEWVLRAHRI